MPSKMPPEPWLSFLRELASQATENMSLHCSGGFVMTQLFDLACPTSDVDTFAIVPNDQAERLLSIGGQDFCLHRGYSGEDER